MTQITPDITWQASGSAFYNDAPYQLYNVMFTAL